MRTIKLWLTTIATLLCSLTANAYDFEVGGIYYTITSSADLTVEVTYRGNHPDHYSNEYSGAVTIPSTVTYNTYNSYNSKTYRVTSIGSRAFEGWTGELIVNCNIPSASSTSAGIFYGSNFTKVTIGGAVTSIGDYAFYGCSSLTAITFPESVTSIGNGAFEGTAWYNSLPDGLVYIGKVLYKYNGTMPENTSIGVKEGIVSISSDAFLGCSGLTTITLPESVTSIGYRAFENCSSLTAITLPEGVTSIGDEAFKGCQSLYKVINISNLDIQKGSTEHGMVGYYAQKVIKADADDNVKGYYFYTSEENIHYLFHYGGKETALTLPEDYNGDDYIIDDKAFANNGNIISASIPQTVGEIGSHAFAGCSNLASIDIARGVMSIGDNAFENCTSLTAIIFPKNLTSIGSSAFKGCSGLTSVFISANVDTYGKEAFEGCEAVETLMVMGSVMPTIPSDKLTSITLFSPVPLKTSEFANKVYRNATVYVPKGSLERYQAADVWKNFWTIQEFDTTGIAPQPVDTNQQTTVVYDLQGRRISNETNLKEGIYIVNGRKVAIK